MQLEAENIHFRYHDKSPWILKGVSLTVKSGERAGIVGPSGYGKSTLARILSGYRKASSGSVLLDRMGIERSWLTRWPAELSGGELQRFCIARALSLQTRFLICDEITTMLDVITQAQIWKLLLEISEERQLGMVVITHNMALADQVCTRIIQLPELNHTEERLQTFTS